MESTDILDNLYMQFLLVVEINVMVLLDLVLVEKVELCDGGWFG
jgi:hypothetical protein